MKREIMAEADINAFANEVMGNGCDKVSKSEPEPFIWIGGEELTKMAPRRKQMVVDKILSAGALTLNASKAKTGKTTLMVEICHAVATGRRALGHYAVIQGPVLYWLADDPNVSRFAEAWRIVSGDVKIESFHLSTKRQHLYPDGIINLRKAAKQFQPLRIVVDSYTTIRTPRTKNTDFVKAEYDDMRRLSELSSNKTVYAVLLLWRVAAISAAMNNYVSEQLEILQDWPCRVLPDWKVHDAFQITRRLFHAPAGQLVDSELRILLLAEALSKPK